MAKGFTTERFVEFGDTDMAGIMHFASFFHYMESIEHEFLRSLGLSIYTQVDGHPVTFPRVAARCDFFAPARCEDMLQATLTVLCIGRTSATYRIDFRRDETPIARGEVTCVCCRMFAEKPPKAIPWPPEFTDPIQAYLVSEMEEPTSPAAETIIAPLPRNPRRPLTMLHISELAARLQSVDTTTRRQASEELSQSGPSAAAAAATVVQHADDEDRVVAEYCVATLEEMGPPELDQLPALGELAHEGSPDVAYWAVTLLGRAGGEAAGQVGILAELVASDRPATLRQRAAWALGKIGPAAATAVPQLQQASQSTDAGLSRAATKALAEIDC